MAIIAVSETLLREFAPGIEQYVGFINLCGGRVQSITVNPFDSKEIIVANQIGGMWKTQDGGKNWFHLSNLSTVFVHDVSYASDGETVICTVARDNQTNNGGGIWTSLDRGLTWSKPVTGIPPNSPRISPRVSAYGISFSPDNPNNLYVGTDFGVAKSSDKGKTWSHIMLENTSQTWVDTSPIWGTVGGGGKFMMQNRVGSIIALPSNIVIVLSATGIYRSDDGGLKWYKIRTGNFAWCSNYLAFKTIDVYFADSNQIFILQSYNNILHYDVGAKIFTTITLPAPPGISRGPFLRLSKPIKPVDTTSFDIWVGQGVNLLKASCSDVTAAKKLTTTDWKVLWRSEGLHDDSGHLGLDKNKKPILYGSDGGLFKPINDDATKWAVGASKNSGLNSLQIVDLAGTNVVDPDSGLVFPTPYFATQDNCIWGSPSGGTPGSWNEGDIPEGFHISVMKDAKSDSEVTLAYGKVADAPYNCMFSDANFKNPREVQNVDVDGKPLTFGGATVAQAFFISRNKWIRLRNSTLNREIWISENNGLNWRKKATIPLQDAGVFTVSGTLSNPIIYVPFIGPMRTPDSWADELSNSNQRIGLIRLTDVFSPAIMDFSDPLIFNPNFIYLPRNGSLGQRSTEFDWQAVYGVDPKDSNFIIAPDAYNQEVLVSRDGGGSWTVDANLTREVTKSGTLLLYDRHPSRMQVTRISFDPYNSNRILVGTRDAGIVVSEDRGKTWSTFPNSQELGMLYITNFFFTREDTILVSCYGRGLWEIAYHPIPFPVDYYCKRDCGFLSPIDPAIVFTEPNNWEEIDVTIFVNGRINGLILAGNKVEKITVTPGTIMRRYTGNTMNNSKFNIVQTQQGAGFNGLDGCMAAIINGRIIKGVMLKENEVIGVVTGGQQFEDAKFDSNSNSVPLPDESDSNRRIGPYLLITTNLAVTGTCITRDKDVQIFATGFKPTSSKHGLVNINIDGIPLKRTFKLIKMVP